MEKTKLATLREKSGLTQLQVSQALEVTETTIANWESGRTGAFNEWISRAIKLCKLYDCNPEDLLNNLEDRSPKRKVNRRKK